MPKTRTEIEIENIWERLSSLLSQYASRCNPKQFADWNKEAHSVITKFAKNYHALPLEQQGNAFYLFLEVLGRLENSGLMSVLVWLQSKRGTPEAISFHTWQNKYRIIQIVDKPYYAFDHLSLDYLNALLKTQEETIRFSQQVEYAEGSDEIKPKSNEELQIRLEAIKLLAIQLLSLFLIEYHSTENKLTIRDVDDLVTAYYALFASYQKNSEVFSLLTGLREIEVLQLYDRKMKLFTGSPDGKTCVTNYFDLKKLKQFLDGRSHFLNDRAIQKDDLYNAVARAYSVFSYDLYENLKAQLQNNPESELWPWVNLIPQPYVEPPAKEANSEKHEPVAIEETDNLQAPVPSSSVSTIIKPVALSPGKSKATLFSNQVVTSPTAENERTLFKELGWDEDSDDEQDYDTSSGSDDEQEGTTVIADCEDMLERSSTPTPCLRECSYTSPPSGP